MKIRVMLKKPQKILKDVGLSTSSEFFIRDGQKKGILSFPPNFYPFFIVIVPKKEDRLRIKQGLYKKISLAEVL